MNINNQRIVGEIVAENYKTAAIFKRYRIDFCCNGNRTIADATKSKEIDEEKLLSELNEVMAEKVQGEIDFKAFPIDLLADYVEKTHHRYIEQRIPEITPFLSKVARVHGANHPELLEVEQLFTETAQDLAAHVKKEELMLFPYIRQMVKSNMGDKKRPKTALGSATEYIVQMEEEHDAEGERFRRISELTDNYTPPADACRTYMVTFDMLREFEEDLHRHIHIENNILFPKSMEMERELVE
ncbi:MAG: iron-sulfur cluster repair di-iron protein [Bacteroidales bacterium]|nr:iron-sulfur cluster repair di-iron protein [Bacteroidales bacterium]